MKSIAIDDRSAKFLEEHTNPSGQKLEDEKCKYCGDNRGEVAFHVDHIIPLSAGGSDTKENKQEICWRCNAAKGHMPEEALIEWIKRIKSRR